MMRLFVEGIGLLGPGLDGWAASRPIFSGEADYIAAPTSLRASAMLPAAERRRSGVPIKLALAVGQEAFMQSGHGLNTAATVFTSSGGDNDNVHAINSILATAPHEVSPTRFHNSVHNAAAGYWCIATESHEPSTSICAYDASFAAGLLEAATQVTVDKSLVALIAYDHPYPEPLNTLRPIAAAFGFALILSPQKSGISMATMDIEFKPGNKAESIMKVAALEALRLSIPAARGLPLLAAFTSKESTELILAYFDNNHLNIRVTPC